jgi:hypothetical protein
MLRTRKFVRRVFGNVVRPTDDMGAPPMLLIFIDEARRAAFFERLGTEWNAVIVLGKSQGYTVQDIATAGYEPTLGVRRPVYLHESVHAIVARDLRLLTGHPPHTPLQEGLATYVQLAVHPGSIDRRAFARSFSQPIDPTGGGFFKPLENLLTEPATTDRYAQLASVIAYLLEHDPALLQSLVGGLTEGRSATEILTRHGSNWPSLQDQWLAWGRRQFDAREEPESGRIFDVPEEFE